MRRKLQAIKCGYGVPSKFKKWVKFCEGILFANPVTYVTLMAFNACFVILAILARETGGLL